MIGHWSNLRKLIYLYIIFNKNNNIITTIKGVSPLSITNALAKPIKSLIQYGKIIQNGTPSPNTPVDLVYNNGTLKMVDDELPSGYKRLLGISFDGNFHYETGEYLTGDDDVTMTLDSLSSSGKNVFGSYNGTNNKNLSLYIYGSTNGSYFRYGDQLKRPKYGDTRRRTITFGKNGTTGFADDSEVTPDEFTTPANTYIGMLPNSSSAAYTGDIIGSITVSNRLEWIPCENPGGVIGYYEKYNGNFIVPTGSGTPVSLGYDTSHLALGIVGTPEVLNVDGKNLLKMPTYDEVTNSSQVVNYWNIPIKLAPNTTYYMSSHYLNDYTSKGKTIYVLVTADATANTDYATIAHKSVGIRDRELTTDNSGYLYIRVNGGATRESYEEMLANTEAQLELGSTATSYEPYREPQTATVANLYAVGNYKDEQDIITGAITRRVGVKVLDGTEDWYAITNYTDIYGLAVADGRLMQNELALSTHYKGTTAINADMVSGTIKAIHASVLAPGKISIYIKDSRFETVAQFKAYLAAQYAAGTPVIVIYPLAEEQDEKVAEQPLYTEKGENVINVINDVGAVELETSYYIEKH